MVIALVAHFALAAVLPGMARRLGPRVHLVAATVPAATFGWLVATSVGPVARGAHPEVTLHWVPGLGLDPAFRLSPLTLLMALLVSGIGALVLLYARYYHAHDTVGFGRSAGSLVAFAGSMLGLVLADDLLSLYVFWELTTVFSFVLIGGDGFSTPARRSAMQALLTTTLGGLAMLFGVVLLGQAAGTYRISSLVAHPPPVGALTIAAAPLLLLGVVTKSAQAPFHAWLPAAMVAPTPVSAYLHAAAMVKAGVFLLAALTPLFASAGGFLPVWSVPAAVVGSVTTLLGGFRALAARDLKQLLAFSTVSQLGLLTMLLGLGWRTTSLAGVTLVLTHALAKAALFMTVGIIDHRAGTRDLRMLSGLWRRAPVVFAVAVVACASMAGIPPTLGYVAKESALDGLWQGPGSGHLALLAVLDSSAALTIAYSARFLWGAFATKREVPVSRWQAASPLFAAPPLVLAAAGLVLGPAAGSVDSLIHGYADTVPARDGVYHLGLWHGVSVALGLTAGALVAGTALFAAGRAFETVIGRLDPPLTGPAPAAAPEQARTRSPWRRAARLFDAQRGYERAVITVGRLALAVTARTQVGSLPVYLASILVVVLAVPGVALARSFDWVRGMPLWDYPVQVPLAVVVLACAAGVLRARTGLSAALLLGGVGYGIGALFVVDGAPDLALAQFLVESLSLVAFVFVLRRIGPTFAPAGRRPTRQWPKVALAVAVGLFVGAFMLTAGPARSTLSPVSRQYIARAPTQAGARNVVNAIIVDFRAFDTLGEITVLAVAALGVTSLLLVRVHGPKGQRAKPTPRQILAELDAWFAGYRSGGGGHLWTRSVLVEATARALFPVVLVFSLYLLFAGHTRAGGGFAGGLVAGFAFVLRYVAGSAQRVGPAVPAYPSRVMGAGLALAAVAALGPVPFGGAVLDAYVLDGHLPVLGHVELVTSLFFDLGVYVLIVGVVLDLLRTLGIGVDKESGLAVAPGSRTAFVEVAGPDETPGAEEP